MSIVKIMPCLDMKDGRVVKGVHFVDLKDAGDPAENAALYQEEGADELAMLDIAATLENRKTRLEWVEKVSGVIDISLTVGGGISSLEDIDLTLRAGADKVSINSAAVQNPEMVKEAAMEYGKDRITVAVDGCRNRSCPLDLRWWCLEELKQPVLMLLNGLNSAKNWVPGLFSPQVWMVTGLRMVTTLNSPKQFQMQLIYQLLHLAVRVNFQTLKTQF